MDDLASIWISKSKQCSELTNIDLLSIAIPELSDESMENLSVYIGYLYWQYIMGGMLTNVRENIIVDNLNKIFESRKYILNNAYENFDVHLTKLMDKEYFKNIGYLYASTKFDKDDIPKFKTFFYENLVLKYGDVDEINNIDDDVTIFIL